MFWVNIYILPDKVFIFRNGVLKACVVTFMNRSYMLAAVVGFELGTH